MNSAKNGRVHSGLMISDRRYCLRIETDGETNIVLYDRALHKLSPTGTSRLVGCRPELAQILLYFALAIV